MKIAVEIATRGEAHDCSKPSTVWPRMFQTIIRIVKYQSAMSRNFGFLFG